MLGRVERPASRRRAVLRCTSPGHEQGTARTKLNLRGTIDLQSACKNGVEVSVIL
jgi:hypothetical protein